MNTPLFKTLKKKSYPNESTVQESRTYAVVHNFVEPHWLSQYPLSYAKPLNCVS